MRTSKIQNKAFNTNKPGLIRTNRTKRLDQEEYFEESQGIDL